MFEKGKSQKVIGLGVEEVSEIGAKADDDHVRIVGGAEEADVGDGPELGQDRARVHKHESSGLLEGRSSLDIDCE